MGKTVVVMFGNGAERWYLVDDESNLSCAIQAPRITPQSRNALDAITADSQFDVLSLEVASLELSLPAEPVWVPSYRALPLASIHRWEQNLWVPKPG